MPENDSLKPLLERLCTLQEEQLALTRESIERHTRLMEKEEKLQELWQRQLTLHEEHQKKYDERVERHERAVRIRGVITLLIWASIAVAFLVSRFW